MKNQIFLISLFVASAMQAEETFVSKQFAWKYTIAAKDSTNLDDICKFNTQMRALIDEVKRGNNPAVYQNFLNFVKEVQEAIAAGLNLYGVVQTQEEAIVVENVGEAIETMIEEIAEDVAVKNEVTADSATASDASSEEAIDGACDNDEQVVSENIAPVAIVENKPDISINIVFMINDASQVETWTVAVAKLQALADAMNANTLSGDEVVSEIDAVYNILQALQVADIALAAA